MPLGTSYYSVPIVGDINGDDSPDIVVATDNTLVGPMYSSQVQGYSADGQPLAGFPKHTAPEMELRTPPALGDIDQNGKIDIVVKSEDGFIYAWEEEFTSDILGMQRPMHRANIGNTGALETQLSIDQVVSPITETQYLLSGTRSPGGSVSFSSSTGATFSSMICPSTTTWQTMVSDLLEGTNSITVVGSSRVIFEFDIVVDTTPPTVQIISPLSGTSSDLTPLLSYTVNENGTIISEQVFIDGLAVPQRSGDYLGPFVDGLHSVRIEVQDEVGQLGEAEVEFVVESISSEVAVNHLGSFSQPYLSVQDAYNAASNGDIIQIQKGVLIENLVFDRSIDVILSGGYENDFLEKTGNSKIYGELSIENGSIVFDHIVIE